jgi:hypothetical protein
MIDLLVTPAVIDERVVSTNRYQDSNSDVWKGVPKWIRELSLCIRKHESINMGHYEAENPTSTASGAYQMIYRFWHGNAKWVPIAKKYANGPAGNAPARVQDAVFIHSIRNGGVLAWKGTGCGYGT